MVYPGAVHSRFEHSLGVYWLASEAVHTIKTHQVGIVYMSNNHIHSSFGTNANGCLCSNACYLQGLELGIDRFDIQRVKLAGKCLRVPF